MSWARSKASFVGKDEDFTETSFISPSRHMFMLMVSPAEMLLIAVLKSFWERIFRGSIDCIISPSWIPALKAGPDRSIFLTKTPFMPVALRYCASSVFNSCMVIPIQAGITSPYLIRSVTILLALLMGMAKPIPWALAYMAVLIPISSPYMFNNGPPLFPGLIEASVWIKSW